MDELLDLLDEIKDLENKRDLYVDTINGQIENLRENLQAMMEDEHLDKITSTKAQAQIQKTTDVTVNDWDAVLGFVSKHKAFDILQRRISPTALQAHINAGEKVPGVTVKEGSRFVISKLKGK